MYSRVLLRCPRLVRLAINSKNLVKSISFHDSSGRCYGTTSVFRQKVELASERFEVKRGNFEKITEKDIEFFESLLTKTRVLTDPSDVDGYNVDWLNMVRGSSTVVLKPKTTQEVSSILAYCNTKNLAVCPQAGNTSQAGGSVPLFDEVILSTSLMNQIISLDELTAVITCQGGCVLQILNDYLMDRNYIMPLDLGAKGSCQIGGNLATNAGGSRLFRYGSLHSTVLGVEAVLANGTVMNLMSQMKKDNTGYDLKHLFIGSEGTIGVITKVSLQVPVKPKSIKVALLGMETFENALETFKLAKRDLGEILSSCEYFDLASIDAVVDNLKVKDPLGPSRYPFYVLIETNGSNQDHDQQKLDTFLETVLSNKIVLDGTVASDSNQMLGIWSVRERIAEALVADGYMYSYDFSVPLQSFQDFVMDVKKVVGSHADAVRVCGFGHLGDGNIHLNVTSRKFSSELLSKLEPFIYEWTRNKGGSVSAEHGLGFKKKEYLSYSKTEEAIEIMRQIKRIFDPKGILNPYKFIPAPNS